MPGQATGGEAVMSPTRGWWDVGARSVRIEPAGGVGAEPEEDFALVVAHDLKQPIQGIRAYCELLRDDYEDRLDDEGRRRIGVLIKLCDRMADSIGGLRRYCTTGRICPSEEEVDLNEVAADVLEALRPVLEARGATAEIVDRLPALRCDATLVAEVLGNLMANGLKFNESRRPRVEIGVVEGDPPAICVRDNGIGMAEADKEAIFGMFRRLHPRERYEGTGAGLTIVRRIVQSHGGRVWLESEVGRGSTFFFTLSPTREDSVSASPSPHWTARTAQPAGKA